MGRELRYAGLMMGSMPRVALTALLLSACGDDRPSEPTSLLILEIDEPVEAIFVPDNQIFVASAEVRIRRPGGGDVEFVEAVVRNVSRGGELVATNRRPNVDFVYPDTSIPASGAPLILEAAVGFAPPPPGNALNITVEVRLRTGESATRTVALTTVIP